MVAFGTRVVGSDGRWMVRVEFRMEYGEYGEGGGDELWALLTGQTVEQVRDDRIWVGERAWLLRVLGGGGGSDGTWVLI